MDVKQSLVEQNETLKELARLLLEEGIDLRSPPKDEKDSTIIHFLYTILQMVHTFVGPLTVEEINRMLNVAINLNKFNGKRAVDLVKLQNAANN